MASQTKPTSKLCVKCQRVLPLTEFYPNKQWVGQWYKDAWCKECADKLCTDKESLMQYCFENNRGWEDSYWDTAIKKAQYIVSTDPIYVKPHTSAKRRDAILSKTAVRQFFGLMNLNAFYKFEDHIGGDGVYIDMSQIQKEKKDKPETEEVKRTYNAKWGGNFSKQEIEKLEDTYAQYAEDFVLDNVNIRDYARKVAKASLNADIAEDRMRRGEISASEYKEAQKIFDDLSKSSNFAACRRQPGQASGLGSLGEIIMRLEIDKQLRENGFTFPEDDIDRIVRDFEHTYTACGIEGRL